jgi:hypothetical protein
MSDDDWHKSRPKQVPLNYDLDAKLVPVLTRLPPTPSAPGVVERCNSMEFDAFWVNFRENLRQPPPTIQLILDVDTDKTK